MSASNPRTVRRLDSINKLASDRPKPRPKPKAKQQHQQALSTSGPECCDAPDPFDDGELKICANCGTQLGENNIVAEVTFEEDSRGAAQVQGGFIGENARHARTLGIGAFRTIGSGERNATQDAENNARRAITPIIQRLGLPDHTSQQAQRLFSAVSGFGFTRGRRTEEVAACCVYAACRRTVDNPILLIDVAEIIKANVFRLGEIYKEMRKKCHMHSEPVGLQHLIAFEPLIMKFCRRLDFGPATAQVAQDAVKIMKRMRRDWIATGRHPSGLCGACIILAARMNNFNRTIREVVFVSKVTGMTILKRVEEFRRTKSARLTVAQFRKIGPLIKDAHDPPVLEYSREQRERLEARKRKREEHNAQRESMGRGSTIEISDDGDDASSRATSAAADPATVPSEEDREPHRKRQRSTEPVSTSISQETRRDADGFVIPRLPSMDATSSGSERAVSEVPERKRGRPRGKKPEPIQVTEEDLITERQLEQEIDDALNDEEVRESGNEIERANREERAKAIADFERRRAAEETLRRRQEEGVTWWKDTQAPADEEEVTGEMLEKEFENDPEVMFCILSEEEMKIKEQIWIAHNEDWLRSQHMKELQKKIQGTEAAGRDKGRGKGKGRKKRSKMGDRTVLTEAETPIETPADAAAAMLAKRAGPGYSRYVDYDRLKSVYGDKSSLSSLSRPGSRAGSVAPNSGRSTSGSTRADAGRESASPTAQQRSTDSTALQALKATQQGPDVGKSQPPGIPSGTQAQDEEGAEDEDEEAENMEEGEDYQEDEDPWEDNISEIHEYGDEGADDYDRVFDPVDPVWRNEGTFGGDEDDF
ncbi:hypothetical protein M433DRAFT_130630 [Acidomyces richmondensis BFW]|nr:MAG: hypothetical protein FE78DRAFT_74869 [Acidomyces sp. 'richmondensis']KYG50178.1 hypothetical protein M433DRAFT_130630 [Acidomyces richmondensis BFW]